jgi:phage tail tape-measure protein
MVVLHPAGAIGDRNGVGRLLEFERTAGKDAPDRVVVLARGRPVQEKLSRTGNNLAININVLPARSW